MILYPHIAVQIADGVLSCDLPHVISLKTTLRKKHSDGYWYLIPFFDSYQLAPEVDKQIVLATAQKIVNLMHENVYKTLFLGVVVPNETTEYRPGYYFKDDNQEDEVDRLIALQAKI